MNFNPKRLWSGAAAIAIAAATAPLFGAPAALANGTPGTGSITVTNPSGTALNTGNSDTNFTLKLPTGAACPGDSANDGYRWQTYMVPASVDPATLQFDNTGPTPNGVGASFRQPLYDSTGASVINMQTSNAATPPGPGPILNVPTSMNYAVFSPGNIPAGTYNVGIACTLGGPSATQMKTFWNVQKIFTTDAASGGTAQVDWAVPTPALPPAPTVSSVAGGDRQVTVNFNTVTANPPVSGYTVTATPQAPATGSPVTATGTTSPITVTGLAFGTTYAVTVHATNSVGNSPESNSVNGTTNAAPTAILYQRVTVTRPPGALVFTQVCGVHKAIAADATFGDSVGATVSTTGTGPVTTDGGTTVDPNYPANYPAPATPTYPTYCGLTMENAKLLGGAQFVSFGTLNQVTVTNTDADGGWHLQGQMDNLTRVGGGSGSISGNLLGWRAYPTPNPVVDTGSGTYTQAVTGNAVDPGSSTGPGSTARTLVSSPPAQSLGQATVDARLKLQFPLSTPAATYSGLLTLTLLAG